MKKIAVLLLVLLLFGSFAFAGGGRQIGGDVSDDISSIPYPPAHMPTAITTSAWSQIENRYALVIGNSAYRNISRLSNPVNDANDMEATLRELGFTVDKILDGSLEQMESAIMRLRNQLSVSRGSYGFFFYAGHGVQSNGENFLIPIDANIQSEGTLRLRAVSVSAMLDDLNDAGNSLNIVVLDACRDNPFGWARSGSRGLAVVGRQPADSIIMFATGAGSVAADGTGRNGLFTSYLLNNLRTPDLEITEVFRRTGADVSRASNNQQRPAVYNQFFGTVFLGRRPAPQAAAVTERPAPAPVTVQPTPAPEFTNRFISPSAGWDSYALGVMRSRHSIAKELIDGRTRDVLTMERSIRPVEAKGDQSAGTRTTNSELMQELRRGSGVRFKALGDGRSWDLVFVSGGNDYFTTISPRRNRVVDITIPYTRLTQFSEQTRVSFNKNNISQIYFFKARRVVGDALPQPSTLKIFDFEVIP